MAKRSIRQIRIVGNIAFVPLTRGLEAVIDPADAGAVSQYNWHASTGTKGWVYAQTNIHGQTVGLHRFLLKPPGNLFVDHINGNGLDNRRSNLRLATHGENSQNCRRPRRNTSGVKGISWHNATGKWQARIGCSGKSIYLGCFDRLDDAAVAYAQASALHHGLFGKIA